MTGAYRANVSPLRAGLACRCPRCGRGPLYRGYLTLAPSCSVCGLDYGAADSGDGPAVFIVLVLGAVIVAMALIVEVRYQPPFWLHALIWPPLVLGGALGLLRPAKAFMVALQFHHRAGPGR
jgi:uncharacterized protein (DUF983 family)